jgi:hypothetical protein
MNITPAQVAALQPYIRMYYKHTANDGTTSTRDIVFKEYTDLDDILRAHPSADGPHRWARSAGAGIERVQLVRKYPSWGITNNFQINIDFFFSSMVTFAKGHPEIKKYGSQKDDYIKLIAPMGPKEECQEGKLITLIKKQELWIEYGWSFNPHTPYDIIPENVRTLFKEEERKKFKLTWQKHNFSFQESGEIKLAVTYIGAPPQVVAEVSTEKTDGRVNANADSASTSEQKKLQEATKAAATRLKNSRCKKKEEESDDKSARDKCNPKAGTEGPKALARIELEELNRKQHAKALNNHLEIIARKGQLFSVGFDSRKEEDTFILNTWIQPTSHIKDSPKEIRTSVKVDELLKAIEDDKKVDLKYLGKLTKKVKKKKKEQKLTKKEIEKKKKEAVEGILTALTNGMHGTSTKKHGQGHKTSEYGNFLFFPLRALMDSIYERLEKDKQLVFFPKLFLGNMVIRSMGKEIWINIGDIPIEVGVFQRWYYNNITLENPKTLPVGQLIKMIIEGLVPMALYGGSTGEYGNTNFGEIVRNDYNTIDLKTVTTVNFKELYTGTDKKDKKKENLTNLAKLFKKITKDKDKTNSVMFYHQYMVEEVRETTAISPLLRNLGDRTFDRKKDHKDGMYHFHIGEDRGILKKIDFSYIDMPELRSALIFDKGRDSSIPFLKNAYKGNPSMIGNNLFTKGAFFVLPVNPLGITPQEDPGIRGYYRIDQMTDTISAGNYTTTVNGTNLYNGTQKKKTTKQLVKNSKEEGELKGYKTYVQHNLIDHIKKDLLYWTNINHAYKVKPVPGPDCNKDPAASKSPTKKCAAQRGDPVWKEKAKNYEKGGTTSRCKCNNGYWWSLAAKRCYCDQYQIVKKSGNWYEYEEKQTSAGTWKCVRKSNKPVKPPTSEQHKKADKIRLAHACAAQKEIEAKLAAGKPSEKVKKALGTSAEVKKGK